MTPKGRIGYAARIKSGFNSLFNDGGSAFDVSEAYIWLAGKLD